MIYYLVFGDYYCWSIRNGGLLLFGFWTPGYTGRYGNRMAY